MSNSTQLPDAEGTQCVQQGAWCCPCWWHLCVQLPCHRVDLSPLRLSQNPPNWRTGKKVMCFFFLFKLLFQRSMWFKTNVLNKCWTSWRSLGSSEHRDTAASCQAVVKAEGSPPAEPSVSPVSVLSNHQLHDPGTRLSDVCPSQVVGEAQVHHQPASQCPARKQKDVWFLLS